MLRDAPKSELAGHVACVKETKYGCRGDVQKLSWADAAINMRVRSMTVKQERGLERHLVYPVFLIEDQKAHKFTGYDVINNRLGFTVFGRVPNSQKYRKGLVFDASGYVFSYRGSAGWPRFQPKTCVVLDNLLIPGLLTKLGELLGYFGPNLLSKENLDLGSYGGKLLTAMSVFEKKDFPELEQLLFEKQNFESMIEAIHWFRMYGGRRDEDGHPKHLEDGSINPEYSK